MSLGKNIAKFRKVKNLTQEELGGMLGVTNQAVSKWESGVTMPDVMLLPHIASALEVTLDDLYGLEKAPEKSSVSADEFPAFAYQKLHELFINNTHISFTNIDPSAETQMDYQMQKLKNGFRIGCLSNTRGAFIMTDNFAFIDRDYKSEENGICPQDDVLYALMYFTDRNLQKILRYQYKVAFARSKESNTEFSLAEIIQGCNLSECEANAGLHLLEEIKINEVYIDPATKTKKYIFRISNAVYAFAIYKLAELLSEDDVAWLAVRDTSIISDYVF